jgi:hypothetical protein
MFRAGLVTPSAVEAADRIDPVNIAFKNRITGAGFFT